MGRKRKPDFKDIMALNTYCYERLSLLSFRNMLDNVHRGCYIEACSTNQSGTVEAIIRSMNGVPVCLKVRSGDGSIDYISVERVSFWEPFDTYVPNDTYDENYLESLIE